ncbi:MAG: 2Fe-2S iron-sulfur cluster-binding protein [Planctomycetota bacterium]
MPRVTIDGREVDVVPGSNLLAAARKLGLDIPALCYQPGCTPNTACMACVVKVRDPDRIVPSCATPAADGLVVESETPELHALRRTALELLLSDHCGAETDPDHPGRLRCDCSKRDVCRLRKYAELYHADPAHYRGARRHVERDYQHPYIAYDPGKCILCGLCIQIAQQFREPWGLTWVGRGFDVRVEAALGAPLASALRTAARRCAGACPTAALTLREIGGVPVETRREVD